MIKNADYLNDMFSGETFGITLKLLTTWQVIVVTIVVILFIFLVNYVTRYKKGPRKVSKLKAIVKKKDPAVKKMKKNEPEVLEGDDII